MAENKPTLLLVEDDPDVLEMLDAYFNVQGYSVYPVEEGEAAVNFCRSKRPDLILLDIHLPDIDGYEVARRLRTNQRTNEIPIIFLTEKRAKSDRLQGLELGADDYITKPFDIQELRLRVRNALRRSAQGTLTNPVTLLPDGVLVDERLLECLEEDDWVILLVSLQNLDHFRESYGFVASDDVLRAISLMIRNAVRETGNASDFIGHLDLYDFLVVTTPSMVEDLKQRIRRRIKQSIDYFYPVKEREEGKHAKNRIKLKFGALFASQGPFADLSGIKKALRRQID